MSDTRANDCAEQPHLHVGICQRAGYANGLADARDAVRVGFRYQDGEVLSPDREALSEDIEIPAAVIDLGDGEWLSLGDLRALHSERLEQALESWDA